MQKNFFVFFSQVLYTSILYAAKIYIYNWDFIKTPLVYTYQLLHIPSAKAFICTFNDYFNYLHLSDNLL